ncbi:MULTISPECIES: DUF4405 domain-containing protein [unclassified Romboutsia]|uniref:DUF4405 domain-containing protein n=1 Tax=unclassified Romboutsia TaxID=2626894 RepID=UPI0008222D3C|nr:MULTISPECIES: DUF4405 domain-containing protein [unclassified Romboutsia]SCH40350.1 Uncharacterised protein [uncultured Clostridium sp.]
MSTKNKIKLTLDIAMAILFITFFKKNLISFKFHTMSGLVFGIFILAHMILNRKWIVNISKRLFDRKIKFRTKFSYLLSLILLISIITIILSGVFIMKANTYDRVMFWKMLHFGASYLSLSLIGIHIGIYWSWVMNMSKNVFKIKKDTKVTKLISTLVVLIILALGSYTIYSQKYFTKTYSCLEYVVQHIKPQDIDGGNSYYGEHEKPSFINVASTYGSILSVFSIATYYCDKTLKKNKKHVLKISKDIA